MVQVGSNPSENLTVISSLRGLGAPKNLKALRKEGQLKVLSQQAQYHLGLFNTAEERDAQAAPLLNALGVANMRLNRANGGTTSENLPAGAWLNAANTVVAQPFEVLFYAGLAREVPSSMFVERTSWSGLGHLGDNQVLLGGGGAPIISVENKYASLRPLRGSEGSVTTAFFNSIRLSESIGEAAESEAAARRFFVFAFSTPAERKARALSGTATFAVCSERDLAQARIMSASENTPGSGTRPRLDISEYTLSYRSNAIRGTGSLLHKRYTFTEAIAQILSALN